jgi:hypothetical protein
MHYANQIHHALRKSRKYITLVKKYINNRLGTYEHLSLIVSKKENDSHTNTKIIHSCYSFHRSRLYYTTNGLQTDPLIAAELQMKKTWHIEFSAGFLNN